MKKRLGLALTLTATLTATLCTIGLAAASEQRDRGEDAAATCIEVEVNGERAPSFSCLTQKLSPNGNVARPTAVPPLASEAITQRPSNQLGLFNHSATSQRMGNTFGSSVYPQRPENHTPVSPIFPRSVP